MQIIYKNCMLKNVYVKTLLYFDLVYIQDCMSQNVYVENCYV